MNTSKTLLAILVEKLQKNGGWPKFDREMQVVQDYDGEVKFHFIGHALEFERNNPGTWGSNTPKAWLEDFAPQSNFFADLASDYSTAIITREQYEAALAAKNEGWIEWAGGECPLENGTKVDVKDRDGYKHLGEIICYTNNVDNIFWQHGVCSYPDNEIIAYRLNQPQEAVQAKADDEADLNDCIGQQQEDLDALRTKMVGDIYLATGSITLNDAFNIAHGLIDAGYRKQ